jgi:hypothetical protein
VSQSGRDGARSGWSRSFGDERESRLLGRVLVLGTGREQRIESGVIVVVVGLALLALGGRLGQTVFAAEVSTLDLVAWVQSRQ